MRRAAKRAFLKSQSCAVACMDEPVAALSKKVNEVMLVVQARSKASRGDKKKK